MGENKVIKFEPNSAYLCKITVSNPSKPWFPYIVAENTVYFSDNEGFLIVGDGKKLESGGSLYFEKTS